MDRQSAPVATLTLQQLDAPRPGGQAKRLTLTGRAAPVDNIRWGVAQRGTLRHYPGSGAAAVFLDGPEESDVELMFDWKTRTLGDGDATLDDASLANADDLVAAVEDLVRDQALVELRWRERAVVGYLAEVVPVEGFESEYTATLTFKPTESPRFERGQRPAVQTPPAALFEAMNSDWQAVEERDPPVSAPRAVLEDVESAIDDVSATFRRFGEWSSEAEQTGLAASNSYRGVGEILSTIVNQAADLRDAVMAPAANIAQTDDPLMQLRAAKYQRDMHARARNARHAAARERRYYALTEGRDVLGVHVVSDGETLWGISWRWYGTTEAWKLIAKKNALAATSPRAGTRLIIPRREAA